MARYDRRLLVPYLADVCAAELICRKLDDEMTIAKKNADRAAQRVQAVYNIKAPYEPVKEDYKTTGFSWISFLIGILEAILTFAPNVPLFFRIVFIVGCFLFVYWAFSGVHSAKDQYEAAVQEYQQQKWQYEKQREQKRIYEGNYYALKKEYRSLQQEYCNAEALKTQLYGVNIIPSRYRTVHAAYYLYDYFSTCQETDLDKIIQTMLLDEIVQRLDKVIEQQSEILLNQRRQIALQQQTFEEVNENHQQQMLALARQEQNQELQTEYLAMIEGNTRANAYFAAATWLQGLDR